MALEIFDFSYHTVSTENPESGFRVQLGNSYTFTTPPTAPDQRTFQLNFPGMKFFLNPDGTIDETVNPAYNMMRLIRFYQAHKLHLSFKYDHPVHGELEVKFGKPLVEPEGIIGGTGVTKEFTVTLTEQP